jgi:hypothetical protein
MPGEVICPCGERFLIGNRAFPCTIACPLCGSRTVLNSPAEFAQENGWTLGPEERPGSTEVPGARYGSLRCSYCSYAASAACARCGRFYCSHHGRARLNGNSTCIDCYDRQRPLFFAIAVIFTPMAMAPLLMPLFVSGLKDFGLIWYGIFGPLALAFFASAALNLWFALRAYP